MLVQFREISVYFETWETWDALNLAGLKLSRDKSFGLRSSLFLTPYAPDQRPEYQ